MKKNQKKDLNLTGGPATNYNIESEGVISDTRLSDVVPGILGSIDGFISGERTEPNNRSTVHYLELIPNSHFWTSIEMMLEWLKQNNKKVIDSEFLRIGLENTLKQGYQITKKDENQV